MSNQIDLGQFIWPDVSQGRQPKGVAAIDWTNPITQNPVFLHNFAGTPLGNDATGNGYSLASGSGTPALAATPAGVGSLFQASGPNSLIFSKAINIPANAPFTMFLYCTVNQAAMTSGYGVVLSLRGASGTPIILISVGNNNASPTYSGAPAFLVRDDATNLVHAIGSAAVDTNPHLWVITRNAAGVITGYLDNTALPLGGGVTSSISCTAADQAYGCDPLNTSLGYLTGTVLYGGLVLNNWTAQQVAQVVANPWQLFATPTLGLYVPSSGGTHPYTLSGSAGNYAINGQAATLTVARKLAGSAGSYAINGQAATLTVGRKLAGSAGSYAINGQNATLTVARKLSGAAGSYSIYGQTATLTYTPGSGSHPYTLSGASGSYAITGQAATLLYTSGAKFVTLKAGSWIRYRNI